jgi:phosphatidylserine decarboxylase
MTTVPLYKIKDYITLLGLLNEAISNPPTYVSNDIPGLTISNILTPLIVTDAGFTTFCNDKVNAILMQILNTWKYYLASPDSASALDGAPKSGWLNKESIQKLAYYLPADGSHPAGYDAALKTFKDAFVKPEDQQQPRLGFHSWDHFFIRRFIDMDKYRPLPTDYSPLTIVSACESTIYNIASNVSEFGKFWLKDPWQYSLKHMLNDDELAPTFYGGTVYQAFLNSTDYHRWHSPVTGTIKKVSLVQGSYYALPPTMRPKGVKEIDVSIQEEQAYLSVVATRALIFIQCAAPVGLVCFIGVGMVEVSSCEITVVPGQQIKKGDQLGTFHFGGSTHVVLFRKGLKFTLNPKLTPPKPDGTGGSHVHIRSKIGTVEAIVGN